jgi:BirA family biotin operon repressor/biotin-[acetyl-CoA-carboxylase] ligase
MSPVSTLMKILADGYFHSGTELGQAMRCSRSAVWKVIHSLRSSGIEIYSVRGKGYRLSSQIDLLDSEEISSHLDAKTKTILQKLEVHFELPSTNAHLLEAVGVSETSGVICLAEQQTSGRGRRGRTWVSPFGGNLYLSLLWQFAGGAAQLAGLSLAIAIAITRALRESGLDTVEVKWPNDILVSNRKLAGILLELSGEASGPCSVVVGVGLNIRATSAEMALIDQPWIDLESVLGRSVGRNEMAGRLINHLMSAVQEFEKDGLAPFLDEWKACDSYAGQEVILHQPGGNIRGVVRGVDESGALLLAEAGEMRRFHSGEISMRAIANQKTSVMDQSS